jgi:hypothetical protein
MLNFFKKNITIGLALPNWINVDKLSKQLSKELAGNLYF